MKYTVIEILQIVSGTVAIIVAGVLLLSGHDVPEWLILGYLAVWGLEKSTSPIRSKTSNE